MQQFIFSFYYGGKGILAAIKEERNLRFHLCAAIYVYGLSTFYSFSPVEYGLVTIMIGGVIALELVNSAIERCVHDPEPKRYAMAGAVKDMAAGAVLAFAIAVMISGGMLFYDEQVIKEVFLFFSSSWIRSGLLIASGLLAIKFIFFWPKQKD